MKYPYNIRKALTSLGKTSLHELIRSAPPIGYAVIGKHLGLNPLILSREHENDAVSRADAIAIARETLARVVLDAPALPLHFEEEARRKVLAPFRGHPSLTSSKNGQLRREILAKRLSPDWRPANGDDRFIVDVFQSVFGDEPGTTPGNTALVERPERFTGPRSYWDYVDFVWSRISIYHGPEVYAECIRQLPSECVQLHAVHWYTSEAYNGGFDQFFFNSTGVVAKNALEGLKRIGANEHHDLLVSAMSLLGGRYPAEQVVREGRLTDEVRTELRYLDEDYLSLETPLILADSFVQGLEWEPKP